MKVRCPRAAHRWPPSALSVLLAVGCQGPGQAPPQGPAQIKKAQSDRAQINKAQINTAQALTQPSHAQPKADPSAPAQPEQEAACASGPDFTRVFDEIAPSVVGVIAGDVLEQGFVAARHGSGFIWDEAGHIVTNDHIVEGVTAFQIRTATRKVLTATLVGRDARTDLAVLKLESGQLPPVRRGSVEGLKPGQWIAAVGSPYGFDHSITVGVISALGRRRLPQGGPRYANFIQTDASINPGNSGGPLVDGGGAVVGVSTTVLSHARGISFAVPMDMVITVAESILANGHFLRGFAGLYVDVPSLAQASTAGLTTRRGAVITGVVMGAPAHAAGLTPGDIILAYDNHPIEDPLMLSWLIAATRPGQAAQVRVARGDSRLNFMVLVSESPDGPEPDPDPQE